MNKVKLIVFVLTIGFITFALADVVPIEDLSTPAGQSTPNSQSVPAAVQPVQAQTDVGQATTIAQSIASPVQQSLSLDQRVAKLEQQMQNLNAVNLSQKIDQLQQQFQQLQGELDVQQHDLKLLNDQLRSFYQDLLQQIKRQKTGADDNATTTTPIAKLVTAAPTDTSVVNKDQQAYKQAFNLLVTKKYAAAVTQLNAYINNYPNGKYAANAHYWLGEVYYLQSKMTLSASEFQAVVTKYSDSSKVGDAQYKLAMIHLMQGKSKQAQAEFSKVVKLYPNSAAARLAQEQLRKTVSSGS
ncbi:MAG: tol-pal system protein YbgF [Gammaproteobacteria bacterium]|nr:tol-pal system protein YbgF [Gammaproteobacteria bacterium]